MKFAPLSSLESISIRWAFPSSCNCTDLHHKLEESSILETWTENHGVSMASNYHLLHFGASLPGLIWWCPQSFLHYRFRLFTPSSFWVVDLLEIVLARGVALPIFLVKENESKMVGSSCFSQVGDLIKTKNARKGLEDFVPWRLIGLKNQIFLAGFSCLIHTGLWRCFTLSLCLKPSHND